jgi:hypothetical protein
MSKILAVEIGFGDLTLHTAKAVGFFLHRLDLCPNSRSFTSRVPHGRAEKLR